MRLLVLAIALFFQNTSPATQPDLPTQRWILDMQAKNIDDILAMYTPDAVFVDPSGQTFSTPAALRKLYETVFATYDSDLKRGKGTIAIQGNPAVPGAVAVEAAEFTEDLTTRADHTVQHTCGNYRFTYVLQKDAHWLLSRQEWTMKACPASN